VAETYTRHIRQKTSITLIKNDKDEVIPTRIQSRWRVCHYYRKLFSTTRKNHFPLPFLGQMLKRLVGLSIAFLMGIPAIHKFPLPLKTKIRLFTFSFSTYAFRTMSFGLCNASTTFQRCMISIFSNLVEQCLDIFMDDFSVYVDSFEDCLITFRKDLKRCRDKHLTLN